MHRVLAFQAAEKEAALAQQEEEKVEQRKRARAEKKALKKKKKTRGADKHRADEDDEKEWGDDEEGNIWQDFHTWNILDFQTGCRTAQRISFWNHLRIRSRRASLVAQTIKNSPVSAGRAGLVPGSGRSLGKEMATYSSILSGEPCGQRSLAGCSPWGGTEWDTVEQVTYAKCPPPSLSLPPFHAVAPACPARLPGLPQAPPLPACRPPLSPS